MGRSAALLTACCPLTFLPVSVRHPATQASFKGRVAERYLAKQPGWTDPICALSEPAWTADEVKVRHAAPRCSRLRSALFAADRPTDRPSRSFS